MHHLHFDFYNISRILYLQEPGDHNHSMRPLKKRETSPLSVDLNEVGENIKDIFLKLRHNKFHRFRAIGRPSLGLVTSYRDPHNAVARPSLRVSSLLSKQHRRLSHTGDGRAAFSSLRMLRGRKRKLIRSRIIFLHSTYHLYIVGNRI